MSYLTFCQKKNESSDFEIPFDRQELEEINERLDFIITGVVDPRWLNVDGEIYSYNVSNLQFALSGRGTISRSQNEGIFNRFVKYLF